MKDNYNIIKKVNILISENKFDKAMETLEQIRNLDNFSRYQMEYELLKRKINESSMIYGMRKSESQYKYYKLMRAGKLSRRYDEHIFAYQYFMSAAYLTNLPTTYYKAAKEMFFYHEHDKAAALFNKYIEIGYFKLSKSYYFLLRCNGLSNEEKREVYKIKREVDLALAKIGDYRLIKEYNTRYAYTYKFVDLNNTDIDIKDIINNFELYSDSDKLKAIRLLYQNNYVSLADKYLKSFCKNHSNDKCINKGLKQLQLNKTLYINQGKK